MITIYLQTLHANVISVATIMFCTSLNIEWKVQKLSIKTGYIQRKELFWAAEVEAKSDEEAY